MHTLVELKHLLIENQFRNIKSCGWYLEVSGDRWTILSDEYYLNGAPIKRKDIVKYAKAGQKEPARRAKMITPKEGYEHDSESIEVSDE